MGSQLVDAIKKLELKDGDILLVKRSAVTMEALVSAGRQLSRSGCNYNIPILPVEDVNDLRVVDEETMRRNGWIRLELVNG